MRILGMSCTSGVLLLVCQEGVTSAVDRIPLKAMVVKGFAVCLFLFVGDDERDRTSIGDNTVDFGLFRLIRSEKCWCRCQQQKPNREEWR
jgi:hypothetical protein